MLLRCDRLDVRRGFLESSSAFMVGLSQVGLRFLESSSAFIVGLGQVGSPSADAGFPANAPFLASKASPGHWPPTVQLFVHPCTCSIQIAKELYRG